MPMIRTEEARSSSCSERVNEHLRRDMRSRRQLSEHVLRHTFCSHLAMRGAPTRAVQELAGHADLPQGSWTVV